MTDLPEFKVTIGDYDMQITLNGRKVAAAWGPAADGTGEWFAHRHGEDPCRFPNETKAREHSASVLNMPLPDWATGKPPKAEGGPCTVCGVPDDACQAEAHAGRKARCGRCSLTDTHGAFS